MSRHYQKLPLSIPEQATLLINKGLICDNKERLESYLASIGYYRLSAYWFPYLNLNQNTEQFNPETNFNTILELYIFDRKLRLLVMEAMERIEVSLRAQWSRELALRHGAHAYMNSDIFKCTRKHIRELAKIDRMFEGNNERFIKHYKDNYKTPALPPIWSIVEIMTFGMLSHWFENTKDTETKKTIIKAFKIPTIGILESIFHALTIVRNVCAHHSRLWNRMFPVSFPHIRQMEDNLVPKNSPNNQAHYLYNYLVIIEHLICTISPNSSWGSRLIDLLNTIDSSNHKYMGFPNDWQQRKAWKRE